MSQDGGDGRVGVILGASGGVGSATARRLRERGWDLVLGGRDAEKIGALAEELGAAAFTLDATRFDEVEACVTEAVERFGRLSGVANCVGSILLKPAHLTGEDDFRHTLDTNLTSAFALTRAAAKAMMKTGGSIVMVSSAAGHYGLANHEAIAAAKGGIEGLVRSAASSYGPRGIRVNAVAPGLVESKLTEAITKNETSLEASRRMHALGRIGRPEDVAAAISWLLDPEQSWVTGQILGIDGGLGSVRGRG